MMFLDKNFLNFYGSSDCNTYKKDYVKILILASFTLLPGVAPVKPDHLAS